MPSLHHFTFLMFFRSCIQFAYLNEGPYLTQSLAYLSQQQVTQTVRHQKENNGCFNIAGSIDKCECIAVATSVPILGGNAKWSFWHQINTYFHFHLVHSACILQSIPHFIVGLTLDGKLSIHSIVVVRLMVMNMYGY